MTKTRRAFAGDSCGTDGALAMIEDECSPRVSSRAESPAAILASTEVICPLSPSRSLLFSNRTPFSGSAAAACAKSSCRTFISESDAPCHDALRGMRPFRISPCCPNWDSRLERLARSFLRRMASSPSRSSARDFSLAIASLICAREVAGSAWVANGPARFGSNAPILSNMRLTKLTCGTDISRRFAFMASVRSLSCSWRAMRKPDSVSSSDGSFRGVDIA